MPGLGSQPCVDCRQGFASNYGSIVYKIYVLHKLVSSIQTGTRENYPSLSLKNMLDPRNLFGFFSKISRDFNSLYALNFQRDGRRMYIVFHKLI